MLRPNGTLVQEGGSSCSRSSPSTSGQRIVTQGGLQPQSHKSATYCASRAFSKSCTQDGRVIGNNSCMYAASAVQKLWE
jgi:hypothetical protein